MWVYPGGSGFGLHMFSPPDILISFPDHSELVGEVDARVQPGTSDQSPDSRERFWTISSLRRNGVVVQARQQSLLYFRQQLR